ncbi:MAG: hypothetical protein V3W31_06565, partial [Thermodesulfobacteriota bacterium]
ERLLAVPSISIDTDWFYRRGGRAFLRFAKELVAPVDECVSNLYKCVLRYTTKTASGSLRFDLAAVDAVVNGVARMVVELASVMRRLQTGQLRDYAVWILTGLFVFLNVVLFLS